MTIQNKVFFITGGSRGIGLAIAKRLAREGAHIAIAAKTAEPNAKLSGTIYSAAEEIVAAGAAYATRCLPLQVDIRDEGQIASAMQKTFDEFGGIDGLINNASAISLTSTMHTPMKKFDLMMGVNVRGTYACTQMAIPYLKQAAKQGRNPHILTLAPPINLSVKWFAPHVAYTIAKYGMSMCVLGHAEELRETGVAVNGLWPRTVIQTAALQMIPGLETKHCRTPEIVADAALEVVKRDAKLPVNTGNFYIDEDVLRQSGWTSFANYAAHAENSDHLLPDLFLDPLS